MKKAFISLALLVMSVGALAQIPMKITAQFAKGDYAVYTNTNETNGNTPDGKAKAIMTSEVKYLVKEVRADGYQIEATLLSTTTDNADTTEISRIQRCLQKNLEGKTLVIETDKDGKFLRINNLEAIQTELTKAMEELITSFQANELQGMEPMAGALRNLVKAQLTEDGILSNVMGENFFAIYYGKTVYTGLIEDKEIEGIQAKTTYVISAPKNSDLCTIKSSMVVSMSKEDMKAMLVKSLKESMPDQVDAMMPQIDQMVESGMLKIDGTGGSTVIFKKNGWPQSIESNQIISTMGMENGKTFKSVLKESNK